MKILNKLSKLLVATAVTGFVLFTLSIPAFAATKHNVSFIYGTKIYTTSVKDGGTVAPPVDTFVPGYIFAGWVGSSVNVKSDVVILGAYVPVAQIATPAPAVVYNNSSSNGGGSSTNEVKFVENVFHREYSIQTVEYGRSAKEPAKPQIEGYHFVRYDGDFICVTGYRTIVAVYHRNNSNCECEMKERRESEEQAEQRRLQELRDREEVERQEMLERVRKEEEAEQEMLRQLREREEAERQAELERQRRENQ